MTLDEKWIALYNEVITFLVANERYPSKHKDEEREMCLN